MITFFLSFFPFVSAAVCFPPKEGKVKEKNTASLLPNFTRLPPTSMEDEVSSLQRAELVRSLLDIEPARQFHHAVRIDLLSNLT